jgi:hypothetical protein
MKPKHKKLFFAVAAIATVYLVRATGLDQGLLDAAFDGLFDAVVDTTQEVPALPEGN